MTENRDPRLCRLFVSTAKDALQRHPEITHNWSVDGDEDHCILEIKGTGAPGFDITVEVDPDEITIYAEGFHTHYQLREPLEDFVAESLGRIRDMLSPAMRVRELLSDDRPYRWHLENLVNGKWRSEASTGLLFWNWFGRRSECHYMNTNLPIRHPHLASNS